MAEKYCDYINGDDDTGDGTAGDPYQTIQKASTGLTGGDEVRCAKSPAVSALTGTIGFTNGSTAVTGSGSNFDPEITVGDFIKGGDGQYYEVVTVTDDTNAVLYKVYPGTTESGITSDVLGVTSTGASAASTTTIQSVTVSGTSVSSKLKISGGWDLTGPTQDGQTYFRQMHGTFANRYGYGLLINGKNFLEFERVHFLRYHTGMRFITCQDVLVTASNILSCEYQGMYLNSCKLCEFASMVVGSNAYQGIYMTVCYNNVFTDLICNSNTSSGLFLTGCDNNTFYDSTCNNSSFAVDHQTGGNATFNTLTLNNNTNGFRSYTSYNSFINNLSATGNTTDISIAVNRQNGDYPIVQVQHFNDAGDNRTYYEYGVTYRDTADARSTQCLKYDPASATYYLVQSFFFVADSGVAQTLSAYIKDDASFNGDIQAAIYFLGSKITGWTEWTPTTSYVKTDIVAGAGDITEDGVLELRIKVRGTAGNVFVDDLATA